MAWLVAGPLLVAGALLAWFGRRGTKAAPARHPTPEQNPVP
ncbi:hypothetical protein [Streptomonospora arabica]|uniref:Uncharacterized protein n=1 Tax=Streptomonospora arabica TaxID=412417 RepID=A0ABV9SNG2_9ACTN